MKNHFTLYAFSILLFTNLIFGSVTHAKIYKKVHKDGTVEYYNVKRPKSRANRVRMKSKYDKLIRQISRQHKLDPYLIKCIVKVESNFKARAISEAGAMGLMQLMQYTAEIYDVTDPFDPEQNLKAGTRHFKSLMKYFKNEIPLAVAAYHAGLGRVKKRWSVPPIKSTIAYVNKVMSLYNGNKNYAQQVKKLYKKIDKDGTLVIYSK